jgi:cardiolipin synthase
LDSGIALMDLFQSLFEFIRELWPHLVAFTAFVLTVAASAHLVMYKKDTRAAIGWIGVVLMVPIFGAILYGLLGINRVQRRAVNLRLGAARRSMRSKKNATSATHAVAFAASGNLTNLQQLIGKLTGRPLLEGNRVTPLTGGAEAYPQMLSAIEAAKKSVAMSTYIFDNDRAGAMFADALERAVQRGVEVRLIIDSVGARYTFPSIVHRLEKSKVPVARFLPTLVPGRLPYANLRNHRKILVIDGALGFTGGLNIREGHDTRLNPKHPIQDHHFRIEGPVVAQLQEVFVNDWAFCKGELLDSEIWFPTLKACGEVLARGVSAGPDEDLDKLRLTLEGALSCAQKSVAIMTPYFLPEGPLISALAVAALRGVQVDIILPKTNNLTLVQWASTALLWQVLERGCRVWMSPPPFDHTKLMVVDDAWVLLGSGNWDPRSLRLNFEFDVECYGGEFAQQASALCMQKKSQAREVTLAEVDGRSIPIRLRDGIARLFTPYL